MAILHGMAFYDYLADVGCIWRYRGFVLSWLLVGGGFAIGFFISGVYCWLFDVCLCSFDSTLSAQSVTTKGGDGIKKGGFCYGAGKGDGRSS